MNNYKQLGKTLSKKEQQSINGSGKCQHHIPKDCISTPIVINGCWHCMTSNF